MSPNQKAAHIGRLCCRPAGLMLGRILVYRNEEAPAHDEPGLLPPQGRNGGGAITVVTYTRPAMFGNPLAGF